MATLIIFAAFVACSLLLSTYAVPINLVEEMFHHNTTRNSEILLPKINKRSTQRGIQLFSVGITSDIDTDEIKLINTDKIKFKKREIDNQKKTLINRLNLDRRSTV